MIAPQPATFKRNNWGAAKATQERKPSENP